MSGHCQLGVAMRRWEWVAVCSLALASGCANDIAMRTASHAKDVPVKVCVAVQEYVAAQSGIEPRLERELRAVRIESLILDEKGAGFGFGELWRFDPAQKKLISSGCWVGNERTWYEVRFRSVAGRLRVTEVKKLRETVKK
jgi:hypothetical protein